MPKVKLEDCLLYSILNRVHNKDETIALFNKDDVDQIFANCNDQKDLYKYIADKINTIGTPDNSDDYDYFLLDNIGLGRLSDTKINNFISNYSPKSREKNGYQDPDAISYMLYYLAKCKFGNKKINGIPVALNVIVLDDKYRFGLHFSCKGEEIDLSGDWAFNWYFINTLAAKYNQVTCIKKLHTIKHHPFWPCHKVANRDTINQLRSDKISMYSTLIMLKYCYVNSFKYQATDDNTLNKFQNTFIDYASYYKLFGTGEDGFNSYIKFWELDHFVDKLYTSKNIIDIL